MQRYLGLIPGLLGWLLVTSVAEVATIWGSIEMIQEGWWGSMPHPFLYMVPALALTLLAAVPVRWPRTGGWFLGTMSLTIVVFGKQFSNNQLGLQIAIPFVVATLLFIAEGWRLERIERGLQQPFTLFGCPRNNIACRYPRLTITLGLPLLTFVGMVVARSLLI